ncbi:cell division protein FtsA, partial [Candidatus Ichthyocystis hellenicum]|uniref:cell division protein FtsA n=1 Tax=Candidatus Ichthyocystis hellenicum TaxID=1561003 RepID=UPI000A8012D1
MSRNRDLNSIVVGIDIGTSKVACAVAEVSSIDSSPRVIGFGLRPSHGLKKGVVVNIESTVYAIQQVVKDAENMANIQVSLVCAGITGGHVRGMNSHGMVAIKDREVRRGDIDRVIETARAVLIPADQDVLHILTQEFTVDGQSGVKDPLGMSGVRLEVNVHIVSGAISAAQNIIKCVRRCNLEIEDLIVQPFASSQSTLTSDEKDLGVCLIDIGAGTTDLMVFVGGAVRYTSVIPIAGSQVTSDIAIALHTPMKDAEAIKCQYGCALCELVSDDEQISVPSIGDRADKCFSAAVLAGVIQPRLEELFELIRD